MQQLAKNNPDLKHAIIYPASELAIKRNFIHKNVITVISKLEKAGYQAYLVGGAVRDVILGQTPKDFDIATNATPAEIRKVFKNSRTIGRRFCIVHVFFGREIIEVTTFRGDAKNTHHIQANQSGMLVRDNVYGSLYDDAQRRDFTTNALYYDYTHHCVYDFHHGVEDIKTQTLRIIGEPVTRYTEDPVRMLRAARFAAKLEFKLEQKTELAISQCQELLLQIPKARLFDEAKKLFGSGYGYRCLESLLSLDLLSFLIYQPQAIHYPLLRTALKNTDQRIAEGKPTTIAFVFAAMFWGLLQELLPLHPSNNPMECLHSSCKTLFKQQRQFTDMPIWISSRMQDIWELQMLLDKYFQSKKAERLLYHERFRMAYDFLLLREQAGETSSGKGQWWTQLIEQAAHANPDIPAAPRTPYKRKVKRS